MKILCTTDGSPESLAVLPNVRRLASHAALTVRLLTVIPETELERIESTAPCSPGIATAFGAQLTKIRHLTDDQDDSDRKERLEATRSEALQYLSQMAGPLEQEGIVVETDVIFDDDVAEAIVTAACEGEF